MKNMQTQANKDEKVKALFDRLTTGVQDVISSGKLAEMMKFWSKFHKYSFGNMLLIFYQKPEATVCAGYKTWEKAGRHVKNGEKGIAILAPRTYRKEVEDEGNGETVTKTGIAGFRVVHVFDVSQTDGEPLPGMEDSPLGDTLAGQELCKKLVEAANDMEVLVLEDHTGAARGYYRHSESKIVLSEILQGDEKAAILLHELAHALAFKLGEQKQARNNKDEEYVKGEVIAEGAAYMAASYFGLDTGQVAFDYVAGWSDNIEKVLAWGGSVQKVAGELIGLVEKVKNGKEAT
jgi:antirestriction protein ArdC